MIGGVEAFRCTHREAWTPRSGLTGMGWRGWSARQGVREKRERGFSHALTGARTAGVSGVLGKGVLSGVAGAP
jgi:hypothetical protein